MKILSKNIIDSGKLAKTNYFLNFLTFGRLSAEAASWSHLMTDWLAEAGSKAVSKLVIIIIEKNVIIIPRKLEARAGLPRASNNNYELTIYDYDYELWTYEQWKLHFIGMALP